MTDARVRGQTPPTPFGLPVLEQSVPLSSTAFRLVSQGVKALWTRIAAADSGADERPLLLSYDVHPTPDGPVLIEVNTNAGGILTAIEAARAVNACCADTERSALEDRLLALFARDLLGPDRVSTGVVAIVDDELSSQPLLPEMRALGDLLRPHAEDAIVVDAAELMFTDGRLRHAGRPIDRIYWRSTDFLLADASHASVRKAVAEGSTILAPSPNAYRAIADKRRFIDWSRNPELAHDAATGSRFRIAETLPLSARPVEQWYAERAGWVFKPASGYASRGVYVGKSVSRAKLGELPVDGYLAQRYAPHPVVDHDGHEWKYDVRFFADRGTVIAAAARVFHGQVVGMRKPGSGFAPIRIGDACCLIDAIASATRPETRVAMRLPSAHGA